MALMDYTSPFFGDRDLGTWEPPAISDYAEVGIEYRNRVETRKVNDAGQVYEADIFINTTQHQYTGAQMLQLQDELFQATLVSESDKPAAILAVPAFYGNHQNTEPNKLFQFFGQAVKAFHDIPTFYYYLLVRNKGASFTFRFDNMSDAPLDNKPYTQGVTRVQPCKLAVNSLTELSELQPPIYTDDVRISREDQLLSLVPSTMDSLVPSITQISSNTPQGNKWYCVDQSYNNVDPLTVFAITTGITAWNGLTDSVLGDMRWLSLTDRFTNRPVGVNYIGAFIASGLPIFTVDSFAEMVKYFQGDSWLADNDPPPPSDWSTDWDIYIKGAQRPNIYITMASDKLNDWLDDLEDNETGLTKSDIKVEYRYRRYKLKTTSDMSPIVPNPDKDEYDTIEWVKDPYNETRDTDYMSNMLLNYPVAPIVSAGDGEFSDTEIESYYPYYAQLEFRLHYGKYKSTWCRYKIGIIGSPSVPDFSRMQNEGVQDDDWQDNSTVTLHYDEYPAGYDPYPTPPNPPMPPLPGGGDSTKPTPVPVGLNGIGLLTTVYKVTADTCKALGRFFWGGNLFEKIKALNTSPIENVVGLTIMPIDIAGTSDVIVIGDVDTNLNGDVITNMPLYTLGSVEIKGRYQSFLDFEPYTSAFIFLPFVGFVRIDPAYFTNKTLSVVYSYDITCGKCNAMLFADGIYVESHQGNCGIDVPLVASNRAELAIGFMSSLLVAGAGVATANPATLTQVETMTAASIVQSGANSITGFHTDRQGGYTPACAWTETRQCYLVIESVNASHTSSYNHDKGRPCNATYTIGSLSGFTVCDVNMDLSGIAGATEKEIDMIRSILSTGFYA